jgi:uncharacterized protein (DUF4415 family)
MNGKKIRNGWKVSGYKIVPDTLTKAELNRLDNPTDADIRRENGLSGKAGVFAGDPALTADENLARVRAFFKAKDADDRRRMVSFRIPGKVISGLRRNAEKAGVKYQTYVNAVLEAAAK